MASKQITIRLNPQEKDAFEDYAAEHDLDDSELAKLLILREKKLKRLAKLKKRRQLPKIERAARGEGFRKPTVTAHVGSSAEVEAFDEYAESCDLNRQSAGAWIFLAELKERWLEKALSLKFVRRRA
jgi:hypothetical protein